MVIVVVLLTRIAAEKLQMVLIKVFHVQPSLCSASARSDISEQVIGTSLAASLG